MIDSDWQRLNQFLHFTKSGRKLEWSVKLTSHSMCFAESILCPYALTPTPPEAKENIANSFEKTRGARLKSINRIAQSK